MMNNQAKETINESKTAAKTRSPKLAVFTERMLSYSPEKVKRKGRKDRARVVTIVRAGSSTNGIPMCRTYGARNFVGRSEPSPYGLGYGCAAPTALEFDGIFVFCWSVARSSTELE